jgi:endonuclease/exonuclease/phosphatase family metal-dependent hydrolase
MKVKFISLNLFEGGLFFEKVIDFLEKEKPDIVALQEVYDGKDSSFPENLRSIEILKDFFNGWDYHFAPEFLLVRSEGKIEIGNAIFSKFPIKDKVTKHFGIPFGEFDEKPPKGDYSIQPKNMHCCEIEINKNTYNFCNLHGIWGLDGGDSEARLKMSEIIVDQIKDKKRVILAGDFNLKPNTRTIRNIEKHLVNIFNGELDNTFNLNVKDLDKYPGYASAVVDMIFVSNDIRVLKHVCPRTDVSDHLPLIIEFEV